MVISTCTSTFGNPTTATSGQQEGTGGTAQAGDYLEQQQGDILPPLAPPESLKVAQFHQALREERQANNAAMQQLSQSTPTRPNYQQQQYKAPTFRQNYQPQQQVNTKPTINPPNKSGVNPNILEQDTCFGCSQTGHYSKQCPNKKPDALRPNAPNQGQGQGAPGRNQAPRNQ
ncbi:hypothetical protein D1007_49158 [Hordeum vulgare]|nr:hypothetical protein D1007_49158 [Hordeum vulgare]